MSYLIGGASVCCVVCGVKIRVPGRSYPPVLGNIQSWLSKAILIHRAKDTAHEIVHEIPVSCWGGPYWRDKKYRNYRSCDSDELPAYYHLHIKCLEIAKRMISSRKVGTTMAGDGASSLRQLFDIFHNRCGIQAQNDYPNSDPNLTVLLYPYNLLREPHGYYGASQGHIKEWNQIHEVNLDQYQVRPFPVHNMTLHILSFLQILPNDVVERAATPGSFSTNLQRMPKEILDMILSYLQPLHNPPMICTRALPPSFWRQALFYDGIIPYLWEINPEKLSMQKSIAHPAYDAEDVWDWELIVRQLAQVEIFEEGNLMANAPLGLRNRRRIWRLAEEARMDDMRERIGAVE